MSITTRRGAKLRGRVRPALEIHNGTSMADSARDARTV